MTAIAPTAATPVPPRPMPAPGGLPPAVPSGSGGGGESLRLRVAHWMEARFGKAAMPIAALAGGLAGGTAGMLLLGPIGAAVGGLGGAFMGAALFMAG